MSWWLPFRVRSSASDMAPSDTPIPVVSLWSMSIRQHVVGPTTQLRGSIYTMWLSPIVMGPTSSFRAHGFAHSVWCPVLSSRFRYCGNFDAEVSSDRGCFVPSNGVVCPYYKKGRTIVLTTTTWAPGDVSCRSMYACGTGLGLRFARQILGWPLYFADLLGSDLVAPPRGFAQRVPGRPVRLTNCSMGT